MVPSFFCTSRKFVFAFSLVGLCLSGCAALDTMIDPSQARDKREAALQKGAADSSAAGGVQHDVVTPTLTSINNRIYAYEKKIENWKKVEEKMAPASLPQDKAAKMNECKLQLQDILNGYHSLRQGLLQGDRRDTAQVAAGTALLQLNQQDMDYLEGGCGRLLSELQAAPIPTAQPVAAPPMPADPQIQQAFESGEYDKVVSLYGQLALQPGKYPAYATSFQYGQALLKNHQEDMALGVFNELLERMRRDGQHELEPQLMRAIGDLKLAMGSYEDARKQFEDLIRLPGGQGQRDGWATQQLVALQPGGLQPDQLKEYSALVKNYLAFTPTRDGYAVADQAEAFLIRYPQSVMAASVATMQKNSRDQTESMLSRGLQRIEAQASERKAAQEPQAVSGTGEQQPSPSEPEVQGAGQAPPQVMATAVPAGNAQEKGLQDTFDKGTALLAAKEYDNAIESFTHLLNTPLHDKARTQIDEAAKLAGQDDRQKAADLFVRAANTKDPESKRKLLLSSRELLQGILIKYPQSGLTEKVQRNLTGVERELKAVDAAASAKGPAT